MTTTIHSLAPVRICDCGGWTDTWFARHGRVFNISVWPGIEVELTARRRGRHDPRVRIVSDAGSDERAHVGPPWGPHPIVEAAIAQLPPPEDTAIAMRVHSGMPAGASTGTSAAAAVAVLAALDRLSGGSRAARELAVLAHGAEVVQLGQQSGIQDQIAAACGGINDIAIDAYPEWRVRPIALTDRMAAALEERLLLVYLGRAHASSAVHEAVIARLAARGGSEDDPALERLRAAAGAAADAMRSGDFDAFGRAMRANTEGQRLLDPALVGPDAEAVIAMADAAGADGWKVNGAGGDGGSLTVLCADRLARAALAATLESCGRGWVVIPVRLAHEGVRASII